MIVKKCTIKGCNNKFLAKGMCNTHYKQAYRKGELDIRERHGMHKTSTYSSWLCMIQRCTNPNNAQYSYYGGRGISVCSRWRASFMNFLADMGEAPKGLTIERVDVNGDYSPDNCKWATRCAQSYNRGLQSNNKTGIKGVWRDKDRENYQVYLNFNKKTYRLGTNKDFFEACCVRKAAELKVEANGYI